LDTSYLRRSQWQIRYIGQYNVDLRVNQLLRKRLHLVTPVLMKVLIARQARLCIDAKRMIHHHPKIISGVLQGV
jgi:hypothetical protein